MSTYYYFRCPKCREIGGFFSRQMWGWGNCNIYENFKFHVAHVDCGPIETLSEHHDLFASDQWDEEEVRWEDRLERDEHLREEVWPHASEWGWNREGWAESHDLWWEEMRGLINRHRGHRRRFAERDPA